MVTLAMICSWPTIMQAQTQDETVTFIRTQAFSAASDPVEFASESTLKIAVSYITTTREVLKWGYVYMGQITSISRSTCRLSNDSPVPCIMFEGPGSNKGSLYFYGDTPTADVDRYVKAFSHLAELCGSKLSKNDLFK
jgi:hypothetical protein